MAVSWFTKIDGKVQGPFDGRRLKLLAQNGHLKPSDHVRKGEDGLWQTAKQVNGLFGSSATPTPWYSEADPPPPPQVNGLFGSSATPTAAVAVVPPSHGGQESAFNGLAVEAESPDQMAERRPRLTTIIALLALLVAVAALALPFIRDPLSKGVSGYDFSTPELAAKSITRIDMGRDIRAQMELVDLRRYGGGTPEEVYRTFEVNRVADFGDKKVVFVSFMRKGKKRKELHEFEKDLESKLWLPISFGLFEVKKSDEKLAKEMEAWILD